MAGNAWDIGMHRKIIETTLSGLDAERASYFGDIANRLQADARAEPNANMVFTVLGDVMGELPTYSGGRGIDRTVARIHQRQ